VSLFNNTLSVFRRITIVIAIAAAFLFGLATTVYLSLRSPEVTVPDVLGKDRFEAENVLGHAGLNFRVRATRPSNQVKPDTVLFQLPRAGEVVKAGQTVAMDISRATKEGESPEVITPPEEKKPETTNTNVNANVNRPARPKNTNKNTNENENGNTNRNINSNRSTTNANENANKASNANSEAGSNVNRTGEGRTTNTNAGENVNRRPVPKPSPTTNSNRDDH